MTTRAPDILNPFDYDYPLLASSCLTYEMYQSGTDTLVSGAPFGTIITLSGLTLTIEVTTPLSIGTLASEIYNFRVRTFNSLTSEVAYAPV